MHRVDGVHIRLVVGRRLPLGHPIPILKGYFRPIGFLGRQHRPPHLRLVAPHLPQGVNGWRAGVVSSRVGIVALIGFQLHILAGTPLHNPVRPQAHGEPFDFILRRLLEPAHILKLGENGRTRQDGTGFAANYIQRIVVHHFPADDAVKAEIVGVVVAAGFLIAEIVNPELGLRGIPRRAVMESNPLPQLEPPAVGANLFPTLNAGQPHHPVIVMVVNPGQRVARQIVAYGVLDIAAAVGARRPDGGRFLGGNKGQQIPRADRRRCRSRCGRGGGGRRG